MSVLPSVLSEVTLFGNWRSSATWRVRIALAFKQIPHAYRAVHLGQEGGEQNRDSFRALNPMSQVPILVVGMSGQTHYLSQSMAILEFLEEVVPRPSLLPEEPFARARARALAELVNSGIQPLQNVSVANRVRDQYHGEPGEWIRPFVTKGLTAFEAELRRAQSSGMRYAPGRFCVGDVPSLADVLLVPQLYSARRFGVELEPYPTLVRIEAECMALEPFRAAHAERQPDAELPVGIR